MENALTVIETSLGQVTLSPEIIRKYLVSGKGNVSDQEIVMFLNLCKFQKLNPFLREVYLIKYGDDSPATMVTGKETFLKRAMKNPNYQGHKTGISDDGKKAWAEVYCKGYQVPIRVEVDYDEYVGLKDEWVNNKKTGKKIPNRMWAEKPNTMLKKVALVQALREAFPEDLGGLYSPEEINHIREELPESEIRVTDTQPSASASPTPAKAVTSPATADTIFEQLKAMNAEEGTTLADVAAYISPLKALLSKLPAKDQAKIKAVHIELMARFKDMLPPKTPAGKGAKKAPAPALTEKEAAAAAEEKEPPAEGADLKTEALPWKDSLKKANEIIMAIGGTATPDALNDLMNEKYQPFADVMVATHKTIIEQAYDGQLAKFTEEKK